MPRHDTSSLLLVTDSRPSEFWLNGTLPLPRNGLVARSPCIAGPLVRRPSVRNRGVARTCYSAEPSNSSTLRGPRKLAPSPASEVVAPRLEPASWHIDPK